MEDKGFCLLEPLGKGRQKEKKGALQMEMCFRSSEKQVSVGWWELVRVEVCPLKAGVCICEWSQFGLKRDKTKNLCGLQHLGFAAEEKPLPFFKTPEFTDPNCQDLILS